VTGPAAITSQQRRVSPQQFTPHAHAKINTCTTWTGNSFMQHDAPGWLTVGSDLLQSLAQWTVQQQ